MGRSVGLTQQQMMEASNANRPASPAAGARPDGVAAAVPPPLEASEQHGVPLGMPQFVWDVLVAGLLHARTASVPLENVLSQMTQFTAGLGFVLGEGDVPQLRDQASKLAMGRLLSPGFIRETNLHALSTMNRARATLKHDILAPSVPGLLNVVERFGVLQVVSGPEGDVEVFGRLHTPAYLFALLLHQRFYAWRDAHAPRSDSLVQVVIEYNIYRTSTEFTLLGAAMSGIYGEGLGRMGMQLLLDSVWREFYASMDDGWYS